MIISSKDIPSTPVQVAKGTTMQMLISPKDAPHFAMRKFVIEQNGNMPLHTNSVEHEQYVLKGKAIVTLGEQTFIAQKDDVLFIPAGVAHAYEVVGNEDYEFLCLVPNIEDSIEFVESTGCGC